MALIKGRLELLLGVLLLVVLPLVVSCGGYGSAADEPLQLDTTAASEHLQRATLRITGMS
jgi:hypothetical protein